MDAKAKVDVLAVRSELADLRDELAGAIRVRDELAAQIKRRFPRGFDGNGIQGDFESLEMDWNDAVREVRACREAITEATAALARCKGAQA